MSAINPHVVKKYPKVLSEDETIDFALEGASLARFGDGELRLIMSGKHIAQACDARMASELAAILKQSRALACIPNCQAANGKPQMWGATRYGGAEYVALYTQMLYGSAFICRPDSAPWIDTDAYWLKVRRLWEDKDVTLVIGSRGGSLTSLPHARSVRTIYGPERDAYAAIDRVMAAIGTPDHTVIVCLGPAATCIVERLALKGVHAVDLGHMGRFMPQRFQTTTPALHVE